MALLVRSFPSAGLFPGARTFPGAGHVPVGQGHLVATATYEHVALAKAIVATSPIGRAAVRLVVGKSTIFALDQG